MVTDELRNYIRESLASGMSVAEIQKTLLVAGWQEADVRDAFRELEVARQPAQGRSQDSGKAMQLLAYPALIGVVLLSGATFYLWQDRLHLSNTKNQKIKKVYTQPFQPPN